MNIKLILTILGFLVLSAIGFLYYMEYFKKIKFIKGFFAKNTLVYIEVQSKYDSSIGKYFAQVHKLVDKHLKSSKTSFGIYYDDPDNIVKVEESRMVIGVIVEEEDLKNVDAFIDDNPEYKCVNIP